MRKNNRQSKRILLLLPTTINKLRLSSNLVRRVAMLDDIARLLTMMLVWVYLLSISDSSHASDIVEHQHEMHLKMD